MLPLSPILKLRARATWMTGIFLLMNLRSGTPILGPGSGRPRDCETPPEWSEAKLSVAEQSRQGRKYGNTSGDEKEGSKGFGQSRFHNQSRLRKCRRSSHDSVPSRFTLRLGCVAFAPFCLGESQLCFRERERTHGTFSPGSRAHEMPRRSVAFTGVFALR